MTNLAYYFSDSVCSDERLTQIERQAEPRRRYLVAMTPRSGSSYLCHVIEGTKRLGIPGEYLNQDFIPEIVKTIPGRTSSEYFKNVEKVKKSKNGVYGLKASWFQFESFYNSLDDVTCLSNYRYIYLTRRNLAAQAVSLYKATESNVFHTNINHGDEKLQALEKLEYDFYKINQWYEHIVMQERGWRNYFLEHRISPCYVTYEEVDEDIGPVIKRISQFVGVNPDKVSLPDSPSIFKKVRDARNLEWACRFILEREHVTGVSSNGFLC